MVQASVDQVVVGTIHLILVGTALNGLRRDKGWFMPKSALEGSSVERGKKSWKMLDFAFGIVSVNVIQIVAGSDAFPGWNTTLAFADLAALVYLFFFNGWFRNLTLQVVAAARSFEEPVR